MTANTVEYALTRYRPWPSRIAACAGLGVTALALACSGGCYTRTISAQGFGSEAIQTEDPYQESGELDNWIFGPQQTMRRSNP
ncbi:MAG: hypothetical protein ACKVS8_13925 [Phycisphaerales bacterium]